MATRFRTVAAMSDLTVGRKIAAFSAALAKLQPYVGTVWRSCDLAPSRAREYRVGDVVLEPAFVSATRETDRYVPGATTFAIASRSGKDISALSDYPQDAEVVFDHGSLFLVLAIDEIAGSGQTTIFLAELPRDLAPSDVSALGGESRQLLVGMRADEDQRRAVPVSQRHPLSTPDKYAFPVGMDDDGQLRRVVEGSGVAD